MRTGGRSEIVTTVRELVAYLQDGLEHPNRLPGDVMRFQHAVREAPDRELPLCPEWRVLETIAGHLNRFVVDEELRAEDPELFGPEEAARRIRAGLSDLEALAERS